MFERLDTAPAPVRPELWAAIVAAWEHLAEPGTWWTATERRRIAEVARGARLGHGFVPDDLHPAATEVATVLAARPATTTEAWVDEMTEWLGGEEPYVEVLAVTTRTVAIDTFCRLLGLEPEPFPEPRPGEPSRAAADPRPVRTGSWISVGEGLWPPFTQALVPVENDVTNALVHQLYMTDAEMEDPDFERSGLHRTQRELVAATVSFENECFY